MPHSDFGGSDREFDLFNPVDRTQDRDLVEGTRDRDLEEILRAFAETTAEVDLGGGAVSLPKNIIRPSPPADILGKIRYWWENTPAPPQLETPQRRTTEDSIRSLAETLGIFREGDEPRGVRAVGGAGAGGGPGGGSPIDTSSGIGLLNELARRRIGQLQEEPFTDTQEARRRVATFDTLERQRQQARRQVVARLADQGHLPSSGTVEAALQMVDRRFDEFRTTTERDLLLESTDIGERRQNLAVTLAQMLAQLQLQQEELAQRERMGTQATQAQQSSGLFGGLGTLLGFILGGPSGILPGLFGGGGGG